jgi:hypothetical protein
MTVNPYQVVQGESSFVSFKKLKKFLNGKFVLFLSRWTLQYVYSHFSFVLILALLMSHEFEMQKSSFDLYSLVLKYSTSNLK